jgi:hypothetical protein
MANSYLARWHGIAFSFSENVRGELPVHWSSDWSALWNAASEPEGPVTIRGRNTPTAELDVRPDWLADNLGGAVRAWSPDEARRAVEDTLAGNPGDTSLHESLAVVADWLDYEAEVVAGAADEIEDETIAEAAADQAQEMGDAAEAVDDAAEAARAAAAEVFAEGDGRGAVEQDGAEGVAVAGNPMAEAMAAYRYARDFADDDAAFEFSQWYDSEWIRPYERGEVSDVPSLPHAFDAWEKIVKGNPGNAPAPSDVVLAGNPGEGSAFGGFSSWEECVSQAQEQGKRNPEAYCAAIRNATSGNPGGPGDVAWLRVRRDAHRWARAQGSDYFESTAFARWYADRYDDMTAIEQGAADWAGLMAGLLTRPHTFARFAEDRAPDTWLTRPRRLRLWQ